MNVIYSKTVSRSGKRAAYIMPDNCRNFRRRVTAPDFLLLKEAIEKTWRRWYSPLNYYLVDGVTIGSNSPGNALVEYWRICDRDKVNKPFPVELIGPDPVGEPFSIDPGMPTLDRQQ